METVKKIWAFIGTSGAWLFGFLLAATTDLVFGQTLVSMFYVFICVLGFFLSRIAEAIEAKNTDI